MCVLQVRSTCAIATCLWAVEVFLQLVKAMLTGGAIATMREEEKLNKDVIVLCGKRTWPLRRASRLDFCRVLSFVAAR